MNDFIERLAFFRQSEDRHGSAICRGYLAGGWFWGQISNEDHERLLAVHPIVWEPFEIRDDPFIPDLVAGDERERLREEDLVGEDPCRECDAKWNDSASGLSNLTSIEVRIELAIRLRGKIRDYAGQWWESSAFMWTGYLVSLFDFGIISSDDAIYLSNFLPFECRHVVIGCVRS